jgi:hypothetical protein
MYETVSTIRDVSETRFSVNGPDSEKLRFLANYAVLAPSTHNSQPWLFEVSGNALGLYADRTRVLPVIDPDNRELLISCGAALFQLRIAIRYFGFVDQVQISPDPDKPDLLARVSLGATWEATQEDQQLFKAIAKRRTNRKRYEVRMVPEQVIAELQAAAEAEGAHLSVASEAAGRAALAALIAEADRAQWLDKRFRQELASWVRPDISISYDGIYSDAFEFGGFTSYAVPHIIRTFDLGNGQAAKDLDLATGSPVLAVLSTESDTRPAWLSAGQALARVLLRAASEGVTASYLNQPIEVPSLRNKVRELVGSATFPQLILRMGYGPEVPPARRRSVSSVLI